MEDIPPNFGLANGEPLEVEKVLKACFNNPDRKKFPEYPRAFCSYYRIYLWDGAENSQHFIDRIAVDGPDTVQKFDAKKLSLHTL